jgi:glycerol-3-phosphate acyltransferase PlsY
VSAAGAGASTFGDAAAAASTLGCAAAAAILAAAYLLGSIPFSYLIVKLAKGRDVRTVGSGNAGATNVMRAAGKAAGAAALLLDVAKGIAAVAGARSLGASPAVVGGAAVAVVMGHVFPVFLGFRGGKGVATSAGAMGALAPGVLAVAMVIFVLVVAWKRVISLGSITAAACFPILLLAGERLGWLKPTGAGPAVAAFAIAALILFKHGANLDRLRRGVEPRLGERRAAAAAPPPVSPPGGSR